MTVHSVLPKVVLVGRTNVGKSTLFNRLSSSVKSIAYDYHGVTRDFLKDTIEWQGHSFELLDTGGISVKPFEDEIAERARVRSVALVQEADVVLFICDGKTGVTSDDQALSKMLHKMNKPVLLAVNKIDATVAQDQLFEFDRLGFAPVYAISAQHGRGMADLLEAIVQALPSTMKFEVKQPQIKVALLGKPNVGKSSLLNLLVGQERSLVSPVPGTTREAIAERVTFHQEDILITDTPGVRRKRSIDDPLEKLMVRSTLRSVDEADVILLMIDASAGVLADQELKLAFYAFEQKHKSVILLFNKVDIQGEFAKDDLERSVGEYKHLIKKLESLTISCVTEKNIGKIMPLVHQVWERIQQRFDEEALARLFRQELELKPLFCKTEPLEVYGVQQVGVSPLSIVLKVNTPKWFGPSQLAFFEGLMRKNFDLKSAPIRFFLRARSTTGPKQSKSAHFKAK